MICLHSLVLVSGILGFCRKGSLCVRKDTFEIQSVGAGGQERRGVLLSTYILRQPLISRAHCTEQISKSLGSCWAPLSLDLVTVALSIKKTCLCWMLPTSFGTPEAHSLHFDTAIDSLLTSLQLSDNTALAFPESPNPLIQPQKNKQTNEPTNQELF